ncbi:unnamed protein product, partial [marine sediment metagenome]
LDNPSIATAVEFVAEALIVKDFESSEAIEAAKYIISKAPSSSLLIRQLAHHFLEQPSSSINKLKLVMEEKNSGESIASLKKSVRLHPLNPLAWSDMALLYATLGQFDKARLTMKIALSLGKNNRFILRSAARCFMHMDEPDRAVKVLHRSGLCESDPWIASAEISISESASLKSKYISKAKGLVQDENFTYYSRSELIAGLGTIEIKNGSVRRGKKLIRKALYDPTENALAQGEWIAKQLQTEIADMTQLEAKVPASFEAQRANSGL